MLALHGFNDSRDAWEIPAPDFAAAGVRASLPPTSAASARRPVAGCWPGGDALIDDAAEMARLLRARHPGVPLVLMGESMGGAVLMCLATRPRRAARRAATCWSRPAVWGRATMNVFLRGGLWLAATLMPGLAVSRRAGAGDRAATTARRCMRLSRDPLTIHDTRFDTVRGLVDLMDAALAAAPSFRAPALFLYGGADELVPKEATARDLAGAAARRPVPARLLPGRLPPAAARPRARRADRRHRGLDACTRAAPLPSGADAAATAWLARRECLRRLPLHGVSRYGLRRGPVAQLDRASPSEGEGRTFESCRVRQLTQGLAVVPVTET